MLTDEMEGSRIVTTHFAARPCYSLFLCEGGFREGWSIFSYDGIGQDCATSCAHPS